MFLLFSGDNFVHKNFGPNSTFKPYDNDQITWDNFDKTDTIDGGFDAGIRTYISFIINEAYNYTSAVAVAKMDVENSNYVYQSNNLLQHETYHFKITEIVTRRLNKTLDNYHFGQSYKTKKIIDQYLDTLNLMQESYDAETDHNRNQVKQQEWMNKIDSELGEKTKFIEESGTITDAQKRGIWYGLIYSTDQMSVDYEYRNEKKIGMRFNYYKNGKTTSQLINRGDTAISIKYFESGPLEDSSFTIKKLGTKMTKSWYSTGNLNSVGWYKNKLKDSLWIWYYDHKKTKIDTKCWYKNGLENGSCISYYENSNKKSEGTFKDGKQDGLIIVYFENEQVESKLNWKNGKKNGEMWFYYPDGKLKMYAKAKMGVTTFYKSYDENGKLTKEYDGKEIIEYTEKDNQ